MPQHCKKSSESSLPLSLPVIPTSQLRRAISDLEEELSILPKRSATHHSPKYKGPVIVDHANLYSKPPKPPSTVADEASCKMTQSVANRILQGGAALPCGTSHPGVFFFRRKFTMAVAPALVQATEETNKNDERQKRSLHENLCALQKPWS